MQAQNKDNKKIELVYVITKKHPLKQKCYFLVFVTFQSDYSFAIKFLKLKGQQKYLNKNYLLEQLSQKGRLGLKIKNASLVVFRFNEIDMKKKLKGRFVKSCTSF